MFYFLPLTGIVKFEGHAKSLCSSMNFTIGAISSSWYFFWCIYASASFFHISEVCTIFLFYVPGEWILFLVLLIIDSVNFGRLLLLWLLLFITLLLLWFPLLLLLLPFLLLLLLLLYLLPWYLLLLLLLWLLLEPSTLWRLLFLSTTLSTIRSSSFTKSRQKYFNVRGALWKIILGEYVTI